MHKPDLHVIHLLSAEEWMDSIELAEAFFRLSASV